MDHQLLRSGIIEKLKEYSAYIDNELPDYIMVMVANKKTIHQINNDLQLFLGDNTKPFTHWLQTVLSNPTLLNAQESILDQSSESPPKSGSKRLASQLEDQTFSVSHSSEPSPSRPQKLYKEQEEDEEGEEEDDELPPAISVQRIKLPPEEKRQRQHSNTQELRRTRDQDLRSLIRRRKAETTLESNKEESVSAKRNNMSSVVKIPEKPERPKESRGTSRLLQRAIHDIHGKKEREIKKRPSRIHRHKESHETLREDVVQVEGADFIDEFRNEGEATLQEPEETITEAEVEEDETEEATEETVEEEVMSEKEDNEIATPEEIEAATLAAVRKVLPAQDKSDLRLLLNKGKSKKVEAKEESTRFFVTMEGVRDELTEEQMEENDEESARQNKMGMSERCKFWPNCKNGDTCPYHHPTVPCRLFPNCKYGQKCCFVHPVCKFDGRCLKPDCPYLHTVPKVKTMQPRIPSYRMPSQFMFGPGVMFGSGNWHKSPRFPDKQSLTWTPTKPLNERKFAVADSETTGMPVQ